METAAPRPGNGLSTRGCEAVHPEPTRAAHTRNDHDPATERTRPAQLRAGRPAARRHRRLFEQAPSLEPLLIGDLRSQGQRLMQMIGADFDADAREAWVAMYALVSTTMMAAAGQSRRAA